MREFVWNQFEFIECLGVLPETDEDETFHAFRVERDGLRLDLTVFQYGGGVYISIHREGVETPAFSMELSECEGARYVSGKGGEYLEFAPAKSFEGRYDGVSTMAHGVRVSVSPHIKVELF